MRKWWTEGLTRTKPRKSRPDDIDKPRAMKRLDAKKEKKARKKASSTRKLLRRQERR